MQIIDNIVNGMIALWLRFWHWTTPGYWTGFGLVTWLLIAYALWVHIPKTPSWSRERFKPMAWWRAIAWPALFGYYAVGITSYVLFHLVKGMVWSVTVDPIRRRLAYAKDVTALPHATDG